MKTPLAELDGDEMTRVIWKWVKEILLEPNVDLKTEYYDLGLESREKTKDKITNEAAEAIARLGVGVKCAGITPNDERVKEYNLSEMYKSPNGTIRAYLDGTVFRTPILADGITPLVSNWSKPITIARHAYGDVYKNVEMRVEQRNDGALSELDYGPGERFVDDGYEVPETESYEIIHNFQDSPGIIQGIHNTDKSITSFAKACFEFALSEKQDLWFGTKDTISKTYDRRFRDIFEEVFEKEYKTKFSDKGIEYFYTLIDDLIARVMRSEGGMLWACKNYDGDVFSDMVATCFGSLAMMKSVLVSPDGKFEYEAAHGTVQKHYYKYMKGEETSTNSVATIFAWTGALAKRAEMDGLSDLKEFAENLEKATLQTIADGKMTGDLYLISKLGNKEKIETKKFIEEIASRL
jgi:isocitrate dehydrogenase